MSFNKKFLNKSPINNHGGLHNGQPSVTANTKAFSGKKDPKFTGIVPSSVGVSEYGLASSRSNDFNSWNNEPEFKTEAEKKKEKITRAELMKRLDETKKSKAGTRILDDIQDKIETAGMIPVVGAAPDAINVGISAVRGLLSKVEGDKEGQIKHAKNMAAFGLNTMPGLGLVSASLNKTKKLYNKTKNIYKGSLLSSTGRAESKLLKNPNYTRVYTADGSSKIMDKSKAINLNRIEDANVTNKVYKNPKTGYEDYNWANRVDKSDFQNIASKHYLDNTKRLGGSEKNFSTYNLGKNDNRRLISMYFDPKDAEKFSVFNSTKKAYEMSKNKANEFLIPPDIMKNIRSKKSGYGFMTTVGNKSNILEQMSKF